MTLRGERVLVLGATGKVGRRVATRLRDRGVAVAAASRTGAVRFDWSDASSWEAAASGCTRTFVMAPDGIAVDPAFLRLAVARGVRRLVLLSSRAIEEMGDDRLRVEDGHGGRTYEVGGPEALSFGEALAIVSRASGLAVRHLGSADDYLGVMTGFGLPREQVLREIAAFEALRARGDARVDDTVERVTGSPARPFRRWAEEAAARGAWAGGLAG